MSDVFDWLDKCRKDREDLSDRLEKALNEFDFRDEELSQEDFEKVSAMILREKELRSDHVHTFDHYESKPVCTICGEVGR